MSSVVKVEHESIGNGSHLLFSLFVLEKTLPSSTSFLPFQTTFRLIICSFLSTNDIKFNIYKTNHWFQGFNKLCDWLWRTFASSIDGFLTPNTKKRQLWKLLSATTNNAFIPFYSFGTNAFSPRLIASRRLLIGKSKIINGGSRLVVNIAVLLAFKLFGYWPIININISYLFHNYYVSQSSEVFRHSKDCFPNRAISVHTFFTAPNQLFFDFLLPGVTIE